MKKLRMVEQNFLTLEEGCNKYLDNCRARNLLEGTTNHYRQSYVQFYKYLGKDLLVKDIDEKVYQKYVIFLRETLHNDVSINAYLRDFITTMHFLMREGYMIDFSIYILIIHIYSLVKKFSFFDSVTPSTSSIPLIPVSSELILLLFR